MKRSTIADVAAHAGVSKSTVSHALSGKRPISTETRNRIQQAIESLGYSPHPVAQRLAGGQSKTIGFVFPLYSPNITGFEMQFITGAANVINQTDYAFMLLTHPAQKLDDLQRFAASGLIDGFVLMQVRLQDPRVEILQKAGLPFVLIGRCADNTGLTFIDLDTDNAIKDCVDYLAGLGHKSIIYIHQDDPEFGYVMRAQRGFTEQCAHHGITPIMQPCTLSTESGEAATRQMLDQHPKATAIIVWNDMSAWGAVQAIQSRGLKIRDDISLISYDYSTITGLVPFKPTIVDIQAEQIAARAAEMILAQLEGKSLPETHILTSHKLIIGDSTAPPPTLK